MRFEKGSRCTRFQENKRNNIVQFFIGAFDISVSEALDVSIFETPFVGDGFLNVIPMSEFFEFSTTSLADELEVQRGETNSETEFSVLTS